MLAHTEHDPGERAERWSGQKWEELRRKLLAYATHLVRDPTIAEEVTQGLLLKIVESPRILRTLAHVPSPKSYLYMMVRNQIIDLRRRENRERTAVEELAQEQTRAVPATKLQDSASETVTRLLRSLRERDRRLLEMHYLEGLSIGEIAKRQGRTYSAVATSLFRCRAKLRESSARSTKRGTETT